VALKQARGVKTSVWRLNKRVALKQARGVKTSAWRLNKFALKPVEKQK